MKPLFNKWLSKYKATVALLCLVISTQTPLFSQETSLPKYKFETLKNSSTQRAVSSISQDEQGFIWMGTNGLGLNKYNGIDYVSYQFSKSDSTSIRNSLIYKTFVDSKNRLWVGSAAGLDLYNRELDNFIHITLLKGNPSINISVHAITEDKDGSIIIGTHQQGLFRLDPESLNVEVIPIIGVGYIDGLLINAIVHFDRRIIIGSNHGLLALVGSEGEMANTLYFKTQRENISVNAPIETLNVDSKGTLWLGTINRGIIKIDGNQKGRYQIEYFKITSKRIMSILETPRNTILCGSENEGMFEISRNGKIIHHYVNAKFEEGTIKSNSVWELFLDKQQRIWISYYNNGVGVYDKFYDKFFDIESKKNFVHSLQSSSVSGIIEDDQNRLWFGLDGGGIDVYDLNKKTFTHLLDKDNGIASGLKAADVQTLFKDSKGNIWAGTWNSGIFLLEKGRRDFINYSTETTKGELETNRILCFSEDSNGHIWIGTYSGGIYYFEPKNKTFKSFTHPLFERYKISYSDVRSIYVDSEDTIWIGGNAGLFKLRKEENNYYIESLADRLHGTKDTNYTGLILQIYEDSSKNIWIGTDGTGLYKYDMQEDVFTNINPNGFNKVTVSSIIEDDQKNIWVAGNNGISKKEQQKNRVTNYSVNDGLLTNDFNINSAFKNEKGTLFFGSYEGVNFFNPIDLSKNTNFSTVYLSDFKIFNESAVPREEGSPLQKVISQTKNVTLNHDQSVFTIDFAPIDFTRPEKIQFAFYLDGFEKNWNYVQHSRSATYTNLPAGEYLFKVKAANSDGVWNKDLTTLGIKILRPWWLTNFAIFCYFLLFLTAGYFVFQFVDSRLKNKRLILQERQKYAQEEALNTKKIQFFTNISHEFRTPLTLILSPLEDILNEAKLPENVTKKHNIIHKNALRLKRLIDELMDFRKLQFNEIPLKISHFNISVLLEDIISHFKEEAEQRNIVLSLDRSNNAKMVWADSNKIEKIIFNLLSNAFKSTPTNGIITLTLGIVKDYHFNLNAANLQDDALEISIEDTGKGIEAEELKYIFNRFYQIKELNEQYYGGTGIGLELVRSFVNLHKGEIQVESEIGVGTKFKILIPLTANRNDNNKVIESIKVEALQNSTEENPSLSMDRFVNSGKRQKKSILLVEDNVELSTYIKEELKKDYKVIVADNGKKGLQLAYKNVPDLIITDVIMPIMDGVDFCEEVKTDIRTSHIPVLMLTAKASSDDWVKGLDSGADVYMTKPFDLKIMRSHIKQLIHNRSILYAKYLGESNYEILESENNSIDQQFLLNVIAHIKKNIGEPDLNVEKLASEFYLSRSQLYRKVKALTGVTANELIRKIRLEKAKELIEETENSIGAICDYVGFSSPSYFSKCFKEHFGVLPTDLKNE